MHAWLEPYAITVLAMLATAALFIVQMLVLDVAGIRSRHEPGAPVHADHANFLFRATRAHANTNESIAAFILLAIIAIFSMASPKWAGIFAWLYVAGRVGHMLCYYANLKLARSISFGVSLIALVALLLLDLVSTLQ
ncbi:MAG TPA: MAPEG family protein [Rhodocyclaceae bacterium]